MWYLFNEYTNIFLWETFIFLKNPSRSFLLKKNGNLTSVCGKLYVCTSACACCDASQFPIYKTQLHRIASYQRLLYKFIFFLQISIHGSDLSHWHFWIFFSLGRLKFHEEDLLKFMNKWFAVFRYNKPLLNIPNVNACKKQ